MPSKAWSRLIRIIRMEWTMAWTTSPTNTTPTNTIQLAINDDNDFWWHSASCTLNYSMVITLSENTVPSHNLVLLLLTTLTPSLKNWKVRLCPEIPIQKASQAWPPQMLVDRFGNSLSPFGTRVYKGPNYISNKGDKWWQMLPQHAQSHMWDLYQHVPLCLDAGLPDIPSLMTCPINPKISIKSLFGVFDVVCFVCKVYTIPT